MSIKSCFSYIITIIKFKFNIPCGDLLNDEVLTLETKPTIQQSNFHNVFQYVQYL